MTAVLIDNTVFKFGTNSRPAPGHVILPLYFLKHALRGRSAAGQSASRAREGNHRSSAGTVELLVRHKIAPHCRWKVFATGGDSGSILRQSWGRRPSGW